MFANWKRLDCWQNDGVVSGKTVETADVVWSRKKNWFNRQCWNGRRSVRIDSNINLVSHLICSQDRKPGTSKSPQEIARETGIAHSSVVRIAKNHLELEVFRRREVQSLTAANKLKRLNACKHLKKRLTRGNSVVHGSQMRRCLPWRRLLTARTIACTPMWRQNVTCHQVDC